MNLKLKITLIGVVIFFLCAFLFFSCGPTREQADNDYKKELQQAIHDSIFIENNKGRISVESLPNNIQIFTIDSCQYILFPQVHKYIVNQFYNAGGYTTYTIVHKGNCQNPVHKMQFYQNAPVSSNCCGLSKKQHKK